MTHDFPSAASNQVRIVRPDILRWIPSKWEHFAGNYRTIRMFKKVLKKNYTKEDYIRQFTIRVPENLAKIERVEKYHRENIPGSPQAVYDTLKVARDRLNKARDIHGDYISPFDLAG